MEPPSLPRTVSPIWSDIPGYAGDAEQMEEYLSGELTRYLEASVALVLNCNFCPSSSTALPAARQYQSVDTFAINLFRQADNTFQNLPRGCDVC